MASINRAEINEIIDDRYKITDSLGEGGMAVVFKAHDLVSDRDVAVKMIKPDMATDKVKLNMFEREARTAASLNHQNIVKVLNVGSYRGLPYMINEFVNGQNLRQVLDVRGRFSFLEACEVMYQLTSAVSYSHEHSVIHRDIKPQNIFLTNNGTIKLGDFGIATFQTNVATGKSLNFFGSLHYMAPELATGSPPSIRTDIYAMGITFFELVTGRVPFDAPSKNEIMEMQIHDKFPNIRKFNPKTPECIENIIYKSVNKDPRDRYQSADFMKKDIARLLQDPTLMDKHVSKLYSLFHPNSAIGRDTKEDKISKKNKK